jgi:hypothetical protein
MTSLEKSRNSLQTGVGVEPLFMLRCDRSPVMLTCSRHLSNPGDSQSRTTCGRCDSPTVRTVLNIHLRLVIIMLGILRVNET